MSETNKTKPKAKRKLSDIDFQKEGSHVALVGKSQGGPANLKDYALITKGTNSFSEEFIQKASTVKVELEITEYLRRFFHLYYEDAEILARTLGFTTEMQEEAAEDASENEPWDYNKYIDEKVKSIEVIKSLKSSDNLMSGLTKLSEDDYLKLITDQAVVEKALIQIEKNSKKADANVEDGSTNTVADDAKLLGISGVDPETIVTKGIDMTNKANQEPQKEMVEKSVLTEVQKALDAQKEELTKALAQLEQVKIEKQAAITKARLDQVKSAVKDEAKAEVLFKGFSLIESDEDFALAVKTVGDLVEQVEKSALFTEQGASGEGQEAKEENPVMKAVKQIAAEKAKQATQTN